MSTPRPLTSERIEELASKKGVRRIAVENFLGSLELSSEMGAMVDLQSDARSYKWNAATVTAIRTGIREAFHPAPAAAPEPAADHESRFIGNETDVRVGRSRRPPVVLTGVDGNAFAIIGACVKAASDAGWAPVEIEEFRTEALSGSYDALLQLAQRKFQVS